MRIEANTLQEAFRKAAEELNCSVTELDIKVIQNPSIGFLGFFKKTAIIEAERESDKPKNSPKKHKDKKERNGHEEHKGKNGSGSNNSNSSEKHKDEKSAQKAENHIDKQNGPSDKKRRDRNKKRREKRNGENLGSNGDNGNANKAEKDQKSDAASALSNQKFDISHNAFKSDETVEMESLNLAIQAYEIAQTKELRVKKEECKNILDTSIIDTFNKDLEEDEQKSQSKPKEQKPRANIEKVLPEIKENLTKLFAASCFDISKIEVAKFDDETILIELDGEDAALLIGKEGYRYKAISYLIYNWINSKYNLLVRLEIAEFLKNQEDAIEQYLTSIYEKIQNTGKAKTKPLDGILVKIALEKLREKFPDKYVGIKSDNNKQFVVVNEFLKKHE